jgi:hypothetical protein
MAFFNLNEYQTVQERVEIFRQLHPTGRIVNEIVLINEKEVVMKSSVYLDVTDAHPVAVDFAQENVAAKGVNSTSWVENCATSAAGRALALLGGGMSPKGKKPSREEMAKVENNAPKPTTERDFLNEARALMSDVAALRVIYADAKKANADVNVLKAIEGFAAKAQAV